MDEVRRIDLTPVIESEDPVVSDCAPICAAIDDNATAFDAWTFEDIHAQTSNHM